MLNRRSDCHFPHGSTSLASLHDEYSTTSQLKAVRLLIWMGNCLMLRAKLVMDSAELERVE